MYLMEWKRTVSQSGSVASMEERGRGGSRILGGEGVISVFKSGVVREGACPSCDCQG